MCIRSVLGYWLGVHGFLYLLAPSIPQQAVQVTNPRPPTSHCTKAMESQKEKSECLGCVINPVADSQQCMGAFLEQRALIHPLIHSFSAF